MVGMWQVGGAGLSLAKAWLAPVLIERAWDRALAGQRGDALKPWPWADTVPAARISFPSLDRDRVVLAGATARSMAFAPVLDDSGPVPAVFGHRDTHFRVLGDLKRGDPIAVQTRDGSVETYRVADAEVMDHRRIRVPAYPPGDALVLVTCFPFDAAAAGGPLRYVVLALRDRS